MNGIYKTYLPVFVFSDAALAADAAVVAGAAVVTVAAIVVGAADAAVAAGGVVAAGAADAAVAVDTNARNAGNKLVVLPITVVVCTIKTEVAVLITLQCV